jgi:hypothetical protein
MTFLIWVASIFVLDWILRRESNRSSADNPPGRSAASPSAQDSLQNLAISVDKEGRAPSPATQDPAHSPKPTQSSPAP